MNSKRVARCVVTLAVVSLGGCTEAKKPPRAPPPTVFVAPAERHDLALYTEAVATLDGYVDADIRARVKGFLRTQGYELSTRRSLGLRVRRPVTPHQPRVSRCLCDGAASMSVSSALTLCCEC